MKRDAVKVACPDWVLKDDDEITFTTTWNEGAACDTCGYPPSWKVQINVHRAARDARGRRASDFMYYEDREADTFFEKLMNYASGDSEQPEVPT